MGRTRRALRLRGGTIDSVKQKIQAAPLEGAIQLINPDSRFVVATYWWGRGNQNRNLQYPCPEDIHAMARAEAFKQIARRIPIPADIVKHGARLRAIQAKRKLTPGEMTILQGLTQEWDTWVQTVLADQANKDLIKSLHDQIQAREQAKQGSRPIRPFEEMIAEWEGKCRAANVNFVALNTEFERSEYQNGINGKPLFIKKILDAVKPRGVLYIDGDMWIHQYPHIFDMPNIDFMARGWNMDSRSKKKSLERPFYDPYTFETSGGTMYFGNTATARRLLDAWSDASARPEQSGKADDRILSQIFTMESMITETNLLNLPIEYLWLTDLYKEFLPDATTAARIEDAIIEHPYCLTGEERAKDQSAASAATSRTPAGYDEEVVENIVYNRPPELFYEHIAFDGNAQMRDAFGPYLRYMSRALNGYTQQPMLTVVPLERRYGDYEAIATRNLAALTPSPGSTQGVIKLPQTASIPEILSALVNGNDVEIGGPFPDLNPETEIAATSIATKEDGVDWYTRRVKIDPKAPLFFSGKSPTVKHLLTMCESLADINTHVGTYLFLSRIRWQLRSAETEAEAEAEAPAAVAAVPLAYPIQGGRDFKPVVHQIWFGRDPEEWRAALFRANKEICMKNGFVYKLWTNPDRTEENFPQTFELQTLALDAGKELGQNRLAQVADLARLEIIYNSSGIYIDSLIEISPAFLKAVVDAINAGADFVGCNEDPCDPPMDCRNAKGEMYLTNSFFASVRANPIFKRLLSHESLDAVDLKNTEINHTTGPYFLRSGITPEDRVFLFDSKQMYPFKTQPSEYSPVAPNRFLFREPVPGAIKVNEGMYFMLGGTSILQSEFLVANKGPLATYHSGLGGTWST